jgi:cell division protein FtsI/penicillin-binding protein 2
VNRIRNFLTAWIVAAPGWIHWRAFTTLNPRLRQIAAFLQRRTLSILMPAARERLANQRSRERFLQILLVLAGLAVTARLLHIQVVRRDHFASRARRQQVNEEPILARAGDLFDRRGRLLATTICVPSLYADPSRITDPNQFATTVAAALQIDRDQLLNRLLANRHRQFLWIQRRLTDNQLAAVRELNLPPQVVGYRREFQRHYPQGTLAAHVLGLRNIDGVGQGGIEEEFDSLLRGRDGIRRFVRDARGFVLDILEEVTQPPVDGTSIILTIDTVMQLHVEQQLDDLMEKHRARGACAIVMNPQTGEILALASRPTFDPNHPELASDSAWKNLATSAVFEPGSTFKPLVVAWALDRQLLSRNESFDCELGAYRMGRRILHDHHRYGMLSLTDVLVKSSNIGMAKIGERLGNERLYELAAAFGFGRKTGIELPGELPGLLRPIEDWTSYSTGSIPMGQELSCTPLQLIAAHAILANHGQRISPHLWLSSLSSKETARPVIVSQIVNSEIADWVVQGPMVEVVERGTGKQARLAGTTVFGKTGTAQKARSGKPGYSTERHLSSFVGGANANDPRLLVLVSVDEPQGADQYGGSVAAPYVAAILKQGLLIEPLPSGPSPVKLASEPEPVQ